MVNKVGNVSHFPKGRKYIIVGLLRILKISAHFYFTAVVDFRPY